AGVSVGEYVVDNFLLPRHVGGDPLTAVAADPRTVNKSLRAPQVKPLLTEALARWQAAGVDTSALSGIDVRIADLGGLTLGRADAGVCGWDDTAGGGGGFGAPPAGNVPESPRRGNQGEKNRMDLLTVMTHEVGHLLGYDHEAGGVMQETLDAGLRRT